MILYSKKEGIGYLSPFGKDEEGSNVFLSTTGCLPVNVIDGFPAPIVWGGAAVVEVTLIFCIASNIYIVIKSVGNRAYDTLYFIASKNSPIRFLFAACRETGFLEN